MKRILFLTLMAVLSYTGIVWAQGDWQQLNPANSPPALSGFSMVTLPDGTVLVFGGVDESGQGVNDIWEFDQKEITWAKITPANEPPPARSGYCAWTRGGKMYIHGGKDFTGEALDDLWCFDPDTREWLKIQTGGTDRPSARFDHSANLLSDGSVLLLGGTDFLGSSLAELWRLNSDNTYTKLPDAPRGFFYHATQVAGNSLYVFGSPDWVYSYDLVQQTWSQSYGGPPVYNRPTTGFRRDAGEDIILIFGGIDKDGKESDVVYEYNVAQKTLSQRSERMPFPLTHSASTGSGFQSASPQKALSAGVLEILFFGGISRGKTINATLKFSCESDSISSVETERTTEIPESFKLGQNYPNPFNPMTMIKYQLPKPAEVTIKIYNLQGQEILMVVNEQKEVGHFSVIWDGKDALGRMTASGIYLYRIEAIAGKDRFIQTKKMILLR